MDRRDDGQIKAFYDIHQLQLILDIEVVRRFIEDQARCLLRKRAGQNDPLLFAAGSGGEGAVLEVFHIYFF